MAETIDGKKIYSLSDVARGIQKTLESKYSGAYWIKAELHKLNYYPQSGHCYPELLEKLDGKIVAQIAAVIWKEEYRKISHIFQSVLKEALKEGITILFCAKITFHPLHGLKLRILEIDPSYALGEMEREKRETIERLKKEGIFDCNRLLKIALLPKRVAVISVDTSKGFSDFVAVLEANKQGYKICHSLFPAVLQGEKAVETITEQLSRIKATDHSFDAVAIIRGGGSDIGFACYNNYVLAREIATFPIPVITGIGHSTNETVAEMVACKNAITPTDLADFLLEKFDEVALTVERAQMLIAGKSRKLIDDEQSRLVNAVRYFKSVTKTMLVSEESDVNNESRRLAEQSAILFKDKWGEHQSIITNLVRSTRSTLDGEKWSMRYAGTQLKQSSGNVARREELFINQQCRGLLKESRRILNAGALSIEDTQGCVFDQARSFIDEERASIDAMQRQIDIMDPINVLKRGYTMTLFNGRLLTNVAQVQAGDTITTFTSNGSITSEANTITLAEPS